MLKTALPKTVERTGDRQVDKLQANANESKALLRNNPLTPPVGRRLTGVTLPANTATTVTHGLGRVPQGWLVTRLKLGTGTSNSLAIHETASDTNTLTLKSPSVTATAGTGSVTIGGTVIVDLWIF